MRFWKVLRAKFRCWDQGDRKGQGTLFTGPVTGRTDQVTSQTWEINKSKACKMTQISPDQGGDWVDDTIECDRKDREAVGSRGERESGHVEPGVSVNYGDGALHQASENARLEFQGTFRAKGSESRENNIQHRERS